VRASARRLGHDLRGRGGAAHALLSYLLGAVILATTINLVAGLLR
jgi:uncharacterized membrane protein